MSPFLKQALPIACLGSEAVQAPQVSDGEKHNQEMVSLGWRMQSLNGSVDSLLKAATRLESEMERETTYWDQILAVKDQGWSLCRLPHEKHTLGVRYGFAEANADFRDRGLAALRRDENGRVRLDRGTRSTGDQTLRVRILQKGEIIASSTDSIENDLEEDSLEQQLLHARNSIFDEELHHELHREARNLANQEVRCAGSKIFLPYEHDKQVEIDLISKEEEDVDEDIGTTSYSQIIALSLRILLSHAHRQNLHNRSQIPPPLKEGQRPRPIYAILKPIVEISQHRSGIASVMEFLDGLEKSLAAAGLKFSAQTPTPSLDHASLLASASRKDHSAVQAVLLRLTAPLKTSITLELPPEAIFLKIDVHTTLLPPTLGTTYHATVIQSPPEHPISAMPSSMQFSSLSSLQEYLQRLTAFAVKEIILTNCPDWRSNSIYTSSLTHSKSINSGKDLITVVCSHGQLSLNWQQMVGLGDQATWVWSYLGLTSPEGHTHQRSLLDVVSEIEAK